MCGFSALKIFCTLSCRRKAVFSDTESKEEPNFSHSSKVEMGPKFCQLRDLCCGFPDQASTSTFGNIFCAVARTFLPLMWVATFTEMVEWSPLYS